MHSAFLLETIKVITYFALTIFAVGLIGVLIWLFICTVGLLAYYYLDIGS
jgi:hypothetical protein